MVLSGYFDAISLVALKLIERLGGRGELIHMMVRLVVLARRCPCLGEKHTLSMMRIMVRLLLHGCRCIGKIEAGLGSERRCHP